MSDWISGRELLTKWNIIERELFEYLRQGLQPYDRIRLTPVPPPDIAENLNILEEWKEELESIEGYTKKPQGEWEDMIIARRQASGIDDVERVKELKEKIAKTDQELSEFNIISWEHYQLPDLDEEASILLNDIILNFIFIKSDVENFEKKQNLESLADYKDDLIEDSSDPIVEKNYVDENDVPTIKFFKQSQRWVFGEKNSEIYLDHLKGYGYLDFLIRNSDKDESFSPLMVYHKGDIPEKLKRMPIYEKHSDEKTKKKILSYKENLEEQLKEATELKKIEKLEDDIEKCAEYLKGANQGFKSSQLESRRTSVRKSIKLAVTTIHKIYKKEMKNRGRSKDALPIEKILCCNKNDPNRTIFTGNKCYYAANRSIPIKWKLEPDK